MLQRSDNAIRVLAVTSEWPAPEHPSSAPFVKRQIDGMRRAGVDVTVEHFRGSTNPLNYRRARRRVRRLLRDNYDIVHAHFGQAALTIIPTSTPFVVTFYGSDLEGIVGQKGAYTARGALLSRLSRFVTRWADEVIVVSESLARRLPKRTPYHVVPTAADLETFRPGSRDEARRLLGLPVDRRLVLFAGRPEVAVKRFHLARRAVELLSQSQGVDLITVSGQPPSRVATYMQACDALVLTSRHEGSPTVVKEALACHLPVASVDVGDVRETLNGVEGCVVTAEDTPEAISRALAEAVKGRGLVAKTVRTADLDQLVQSARVVAIYEALLRRRATARTNQVS